MDQGRVPLGEYIFRRIRSLGIQSIFGVPGDYNLNLLDHLYPVEGLSWIGTCNELNAAYAADGYARSRGLPGVLVTTFGVGELSAINGIGGANSEYIPIIHIVGTTARFAQDKKIMLHHTCGGEGWDHKTLEKVSSHLCGASTSLDDDATFTQEVDRIIEECFRRRLPVYLRVPADTPDILVDARGLERPLNLELSERENENLEDLVVEKISEEMGKAKRPCFLVDNLTHRFGLTDVVSDILRLTGFPAFVTPLAKSVVDETSDNFQGVYMGSVTPDPNVKYDFERADLTIHVGRFPSDTNCGGFTQKFGGTVIGLHPHYASVGNKKFESVSFIPVMQKLAARLRSRPVLRAQNSWCQSKQQQSRPQELQNLQGRLTHSHIWRVFNKVLQPDDCVIAEVGCSQFGTIGMSLPRNCEYYTQMFYSCIGFTVGATLGTLVARREMRKPGRVFLFVGDGSLQMSVQEISTMIRYGFQPILVVISNDGYTVERVIHGPAKTHNDVAKWDHQSMLQFFGAGVGRSKSYAARTYAELRAVLENPDFQAARQIQLLECHLHKYDAPSNLLKLIDEVRAPAAEMQRLMDTQAGRARLERDGTLGESGLLGTRDPIVRTKL